MDTKEAIWTFSHRTEEASLVAPETDARNRGAQQFRTSHCEDNESKNAQQLTSSSQQNWKFVAVFPPLFDPFTDFVMAFSSTSPLLPPIRHQNDTINPSSNRIEKESVQRLPTKKNTAKNNRSRHQHRQPSFVQNIPASVECCHNTYIYRIGVSYNRDTWQCV